MSKSTAEPGTEAADDRADRANPFDRETWPKDKARTEPPPVDPQKRIEKWACFRFALADLPRNQKWARDLAWKIENANERNDFTVGPRKLVVRGDEALAAGATDKQLEALPALDGAAYNALQIEVQAEHEAVKLRVREQARRINASFGWVTAPPEPMSLAELLAEPDEAQTYRVGQLWPTGGRVLLAAQYKAGKSTLVGNVVRALVDGEQFLGAFDVAPVEHVVLLDTELDTSMLRRWLRDQKINNTEAVSVVSLRGATSTFDILDPAIRADWSQRLAGADVVILDCLRPVIDALGLSEDKDAGKVLVAFDALLSEVGATEGMVVTHMGHQNERARGDSRLLDWPDALWKIARGPNDNGDGPDLRYFSALGRDVELPDSQLGFDPATRHLTFVGGSRQDATAQHALPELVALVVREPGLSKNAAEKRLKDEHGIPQRVARAAIAKALRDEGPLIVKDGPRNSKLLYPRPGDPFSHGPTETAG